MLLLVRHQLILTTLLIAVSWLSGSVRAATPNNEFYRAFYLERVEGDFAEAAGLYEKVIADRGTDDVLKAKAQARLVRCREELASHDFAALMPSNTLVYAELNRPGKQMKTLLHGLGLLADDESPVIKHGKYVAISPELIEAALGIRGAAVAVTGFDPFKQNPMGVVVFHPGDVEVIRGLLESALPAGGAPVEPIGGFPTYQIEDEAFITLTSRLVVVSPQRALIEGVVQRLTGQEKDCLAANADLAEVLANRDDALVYFCVNAKPMMPMINSLLAGGAAQNQELAMAQAMLDLNSLEALVGRLGVSDEGLSLDVRLRLQEGHRNLVYNLLRTPPINRETLRAIPQEAAAFVVGALNEAPSRYPTQPATTSQAPVVTALDFGREIFANITSFALYALTPEGDCAKGGPPIPDAGAVITVNDPGKSLALWTQVLSVASLASGVGMPQAATETIGGATVHRYDFPDHVSLYFTTADHDMLITLSKSAMARSLQAKQAGSSVLDEPTFAKSIARLGPATTKAMFAHPGRCAQIAKRFMPASEIAEIEPVIEVMPDTIVSAVIDHSDGELRFSAMATGLPDVGELVALKLQEEEAKRVAATQLKKATKSGQWDKALQAVDGLLAKQPGSADLLKEKFHILAVGSRDREAALACGDELFRQAGKHATLLNNFAWALLTEEQYGGQYSELALRYSARSNELTEHKNWMFVDTLARAKFHTGDIEEAIELQKKAIELSNGAGLDDMNKALARMEKALESTKTATNTG